MSKLIKDIKILYRAFTKTDGQYHLSPASPLAQQHLPTDTCTFLAEYLDFTMNSGLLSDVIKVYIASIEDTPREIARLHNENAEESAQITPKMIANHLDYDEKRLARYFDRDMVTNLLTGKGDLDVYRAALNHAKQERLGCSLLYQLTPLKLPRTFCATPPSERELERFLFLIVPYMNSVIEATEGLISSEVVGYINYISAKAKRTPEEEELLNRLKNLDKI